MLTAADIMTRQVVTVSPDTPVRDVAALLAKNKFGSVPVVDERGILEGIVTEEDMVMRAAEVHLPRHIEFLGSIIYLENPDHFTEEANKILAITAREIMNKDDPQVLPDIPVEEVATRMLAEDIRRVVVLDDQSRMLGIITRADIVRKLISGE